jgi:hypothetical protein
MHPSDIMPYLTDDELLLALSVHKERLADPARWCREVRAWSDAVFAGPKTVWLVEILRAWMRRLGEEAYGPWHEPEAGDPQSD